MATFLSICSAVKLKLVFWAYFVSHHGQHIVQPAKRTNIAGQPLKRPSPSKEQKISLTLYLFADDAGRVLIFPQLQGF